MIRSKTLSGGLLLLSLITNSAWADIATQIDQLFIDYGDETPGCAVGINKQGKTLFNNAYGQANLEHSIPNKPSTRFYAASTTKQFTAVAVGMLVLEKKISLTDSIRKYVPELPSYADDITIDHIIHHTDGLRDYFTLLYFTGRGYDDALSKPEILALIANQQKPNFKPGTEFLYANSGYLLLARVVEAAAKKSLSEFATERIFEPLGMQDTKYVEDFTSLIPNRAEGYVKSGARWTSPRSRFSEIGPSGLVTTSTDLLKWLRGFYSGKLGKNLVDLVTSNARLEDGGAVNYGFGQFNQQYRGVKLLQHNGARPNYHSNLVYAPDLEIGIAVVCNNGSIDVIATSNEILKIVASDSIQPQIEVTVDPAVLSKLTGIYKFSESKLLSITSEGATLYAQATSQARYQIFPYSDYEYFYKVADIEVSFRADQYGYVNSLLVHQNGQDTFAARSEPTSDDEFETVTFEGKYFSRELNTTYDIYDEDGSSYLKLNYLDPITLVREGPDQYSFPGGRITVTRNEREVAIGLMLSAQRAKNIGFVKIEPKIN